MGNPRSSRWVARTTLRSSIPRRGRSKPMCWSEAVPGAWRSVPTIRRSMSPTGSATTFRLSTWRVARRSGRCPWGASRTRFSSMIKGLIGFAAALLTVGIGGSPLSTAADSESPEAGKMKLGYVELADDPRYANRGAHSGIVFTDLGRPYQGSEVALEDARAIGRVTGVEFSMEKSTAKSDDELVQRTAGWVTGDDIHFVLADLPAVALKGLARRLADRPVMFINISAPDDSLRGTD